MSCLKPASKRRLRESKVCSWEKFWPLLGGVLEVNSFLLVESSGDESTSDRFLLVGVNVTGQLEIVLCFDMMIYNIFSHSVKP